MASSHCPECDTQIKLGNSPRKGQAVTCPSCGTRLEVIGLSPIQLDWVYDESFDDEYEDEYDFENDEDSDDEFDDYDD